ncbi:DUF805 domain-containing protein [Leucobacter sp. cx-42]|uniref:DUF805 domain-containing protein n=1 Tax=unclassified Leucobacter TaxID=2621730 RepID=UPI00165E8BE3|nr:MULTISPECIES: DUF805 domain-containing protein [unclassified Leucobacter]MBC9955425.1 DUF805 domain-containing protein [Leucobacter sp. cx-42]
MTNLPPEGTQNPDENGPEVTPEAVPAAPEAPAADQPAAPAAPAAPANDAPAAPATPATPAAPAAPAAPNAPAYGAPPADAGYTAPPAYPAAPAAPAYGAPAAPAYGAPAYQQAAPGYPYQQPQYAPQGAGVPGPGEPFDGAIDPMDLSRPLYGATFGQAIKRYFKSYAKFSGRASRSEYWWSYLFVSLLAIIPTIIFTIGMFMVLPALSYMDYYSYDYDYNYNPYMGAPSAGGVLMMVVGGIMLLVLWLGTLVPQIAISWRRLHDGNFPGPLWLIGLAGFIPYLGYVASIALIVFFILPSKAAGRRFDRDLTYAQPVAQQTPYQYPPQA